MKEAGYEDGFTLTMMAPNNRYVNDDKIAQAVAAMLSKINIKIDLQTMPKAQYWPMFDDRAADLMMIGWHSDTEDTANFHEFLTMTPNSDTGMGAYNAGNYSSSFVDERIGSWSSFGPADGWPCHQYSHHGRHRKYTWEKISLGLPAYHHWRGTVLWDPGQ